LHGIFVVWRTHINGGSHPQCPLLFNIQIANKNINSIAIAIERIIIIGIEIIFFDFFTLIIPNIRLEMIINNRKRNKLMNTSFVIIDNVNPAIKRKMAIIHNFIFIF
jgi:hypothetical protein